MPLSKLLDLTKNNFLSQVNPSRKTLLFFKGFKAEFYKNLNQLIPNNLGKEKWLNDFGYIDVQQLEKHKNELLVAFLTCNEQLTWGYYEKFIALANEMNDLTERFPGGDILIINNNIFNKQYFIDIDLRILRTLYDYFSSEVTEYVLSIENAYVNYYCDATSIDDSH